FVNYGQSVMPQAIVTWSLRYPDGSIYTEGSFSPNDIPVGNPYNLGELSIPLNKITQAVKLQLVLSAKGTSYSNQWDIWVYPKELPVFKPKGVMVSYSWNNKV